MKLTYRARFNDVQLSDWGDWPLPDREVDNRLHQLGQDVHLFLSDLGNSAALTEVEGARHAGQKQ